MSGHDNSFVVVANRLPVDLEIQPDGTRTWKASPGGLVTALSPVLEAEQGCWVGWPGITNDARNLSTPKTVCCCTRSS